jgi:hypothetical protein
MDIEKTIKRMWREHVHHSRSMQVHYILRNRITDEIDYDLFGPRFPVERQTINLNYPYSSSGRNISTISKQHRRYSF